MLSQAKTAIQTSVLPARLTDWLPAGRTGVVDGPLRAVRRIVNE
jgi:hypothetical protein